MQCLLKNGVVDLNEWIGDMGVTALHLVVGHGTEAFAACAAHDMLRLGADANAASADGMTPVHVAAAWGRVTVLHVLLLHGGDPWVQDDERRNAFNHAFEAKAWPAIEMLHSFQLVRAAARPKCCRLSVSPVQLGDFVPSKEESILSNGSGSSCSTPEKTGEMGHTAENHVPSNIKLNLFDLHQETFDLHVMSLDENGENCVDHYHPSDIHNKTFSVPFDLDDGNHSSDSYIKLITPQIFVSTCQRLPSQTKEIILDPKGDINYCKTETCFELEKGTVPAAPPLSDHFIPTSLSGENSQRNVEIPAIEMNRTYTVQKRSPSLGLNGKKDAREDLFAELTAAVQRRALRMSGIETLPLSETSAADKPLRGKPSQDFFLLHLLGLFTLL